MRLKLGYLNIKEMLIIYNNFSWLSDVVYNVMLKVVNIALSEGSMNVEPRKGNGFCLPAFNERFLVVFIYIYNKMDMVTFIFFFMLL